jgi:uncharacterized protein
VATTITPIPGAKNATPEARPSGRRRFNARAWLRALHRDAGYFVVGLTFIYAVSGLAVNHIKDWDPSFRQIQRTYQVPLPIPGADRAAADYVLARLGVREAPREVYRASDSQLDLVFDGRTFHVDPMTGRVVEEGQQARPLLRLANWLHLNRGKPAWTYIADAYAVLLLFLATSGLFMIPGKKGLRGRGALVVALGAAVPILYVVLSGGP